MRNSEEGTEEASRLEEKGGNNGTKEGKNIERKRETLGSE